MAPEHKRFGEQMPSGYQSMPSPRLAPPTLRGERHPITRPSPRLPATLPRRLGRSILALHIIPTQILNLPAVPPATLCTRVASRAPTPVLPSRPCPCPAGLRTGKPNTRLQKKKKGAPILTCQNTCTARLLAASHPPIWTASPTPLGRACRGGVHLVFVHVA